jgi:alpha-galactosidase
MKKITFIGAGSAVFTRNLVSDILLFDSFSDVHIVLMDIDEDKLEYSRKCVEKIVKFRACPEVRIETTTNRAKALEGADGVVCTILNGGVDIWRHDIEIPKSFGVNINVGDTRGPAGIFRFLRTAPVMLDICRDIETLCPSAIFLNYTNPMAMLCRIMQGQAPELAITGLCHSVQGTAQMLARWIGADMKDVTYTCCGINHQAFYLKYLVNGVDAYPRITQALSEPKIYNEEQVRNEIYRAFGYYVTESSGHNSEYVPWFRKRDDLIEKYCTTGTGWNPGEYAMILHDYERQELSWKDTLTSWIEKEEPKTESTGEYASNIFNAIFGNHTPFEFNGNVRNFGIVDNLPQGACVEVPCQADVHGIRPFKMDDMPRSLATLCSLSANIEEMAVEGALSGDPRLIYNAICLDPLTAAVLSLDEIRSMTKQMFLKNAEFLPQFSKDINF